MSKRVETGRHHGGRNGGQIPKNRAVDYHCIKEDLTAIKTILGIKDGNTSKNGC